MNLQIKNKKTSRSVYENKFENKSSLNELINIKKLSEKGSNNEICSLIDEKNFELSKNRTKKQRNYHKILSEKLFLKQSKTKNENKNIKKENNINIVC